MRIGFAFDPPPLGVDGLAAVDDAAAEYEDEATIVWLRETLASIGEVIDIPWGIDAARRLVSSNIDVVFNITEAAGSRNRESLIPAIAEACGVPCTGSDAVGLGLSLDKHLTKLVAAFAGVPTPPWFLVATGEELRSMRGRDVSCGFPVIVKPNTGGSSMGIHENSKVDGPERLWQQVAWVLSEVGDAALVEEFVPGRELTVGILDDEAAGAEPTTLPIAELKVDQGHPDTFYSVERKSRHRKSILFPSDLSEDLESSLRSHSLAVHRALGCSDLSRVDFRVTGEGRPYLLEINPLPGLSPFYGVFPAQAKRKGIAPEQIVETLVRNALARPQGAA